MKKVISLVAAGAAMVICGMGMASAAGKPVFPEGYGKIVGPENNVAPASTTSPNVFRYTVNTAINYEDSYSGTGTLVKLLNRSGVQEVVTVKFYEMNGAEYCSTGSLYINPNSSFVVGSNSSWYVMLYPYYIASNCGSIYNGYAEIYSTTPKLQVDPFIFSVDYDSSWNLLDKELTPVRVEKKSTATIGD